MNTKNSLLHCFALALVALSLQQRALAVDIFKADNAIVLSDTGSWTTGVVPTSTDVAVWDTPVGTTLGSGTTALGADTSWMGIRIASPITAINITAGNILTLGTAGIDMSAATQNLTIGAAVVVGTAETFNVAAGRFLTFSGGLSGTDTLIKTGSGQVTISTVASTISNIQVNQGTLSSNVSGTTLITLNGGTYNLGAALGNPINVLAGGGSVNNGTSNRSENGAITGSGTLTIIPGGTSLLTLAGSNSAFSGSIIVAATASGSVRFGNVNSGSALASFTLNTAVTSNQNGTISLGSLSGTGNLAGNSITTIYSIGALGTSGTYGGVISNAAITKTGTGTLTLTGSSTYSGATTVSNGILEFSGATATSGTSSISVLNTAVSLTIQTGVLNAINNNASLSLAGGGTFDVADFGYANLGAGVNEAVGSLILGGTNMAAGVTYGSLSSTADFKSDEYFSGTGIISIVPEPSAFMTVLGGIGMLAVFRRSRTRKGRS